MFDVRRALGAIAVVLLAVPAAHAQSHNGDSTLSQRWVAADARLNSLKAAAQRRNALALALQPPAEITEDVITLRYDSAVIGSAAIGTLRNAARAAAKEIRAVQGMGAARTIGTVKFAVVPVRVDGSSRRYIRVRPIGSSVGLDTEMEPLPLLEWQFRAYFERMAASKASVIADLEISRWNSPVVPATVLNRAEWSETAQWMIGAQSETVRQCLDGSAESCATALMLEPHANKLAAYYGPQDYPALVEMFGLRDAKADSVIRAYNGCVRGHDRDACARAIQRVPVGAPLPGQTRLSLVAMALELGGPEAMNRYLDAKGSLRERLVAAAGVSSDSLMMSWRNRVMASRPSHAVAATAASTIGWSLLIFLLTMRRPKCG